MNQVILGNSKEKLKDLTDNSVDSVVTDAPYELGFMGKKWDSSGIAYDVELWKEVYRVLKPGGHLLSFGGTRTYHRMACAIEDAGFEIRDQIQWIYGSGFPAGNKNISVAIDKKLGKEREIISEKRSNSGGMAHISKTNAEHGFRPTEYTGNAEDKSAKNVITITKPASPKAKQFDGWGTSLKPANEPIVLARKPFKGTVANNVLQWDTGGINIDGCKIGDELVSTHSRGKNSASPSRPGEKSVEDSGRITDQREKLVVGVDRVGRWPANIIHDGSHEVLELFPQAGKDSAARFFYCAKPNTKEKTCNGTIENKHVTVKPLSLIQYLCRLITPPGGTVLDPFAGSGTTAIACMREGFNYILIELEEESYETCLARINAEQ
jgi:site-specific DNA-methyltransferase (adenine-specific)